MRNCILKKFANWAFIALLMLVSVNCQAAYVCTTTLSGVSSTAYSLNAGSFDPFTNIRNAFAAIPISIACNRTGSTAYASETDAVTLAISAGASGNTSARAFSSPNLGSNPYGYYTDSSYSTQYVSGSAGSLSWGGNFLFPDNSTQTTSANLYIALDSIPTNDLGTLSDTVTLTFSLGTKYTFTNTLTLSATFLKNCQLQSTNPTMAFGSIQGTLAPGAYAQQSTLVQLRCTKATPYNLGINAGQSGNESARAMANPTASAFLPYTLSRDSNFSTTLNSTGTSRFSGQGSGLSQNYTVYGRIPLSSAFVAPGSYTDTPSLIVEY